MKILSIGNSFSFDAQRYLHSLAKKDGTDLKTVNLFIGGCSLKTHYANILRDEANYAFGFNGEDTGVKVSIGQALLSDEWDIVTLQQASHQSAEYETYTPYIEEIAKYVRKYCPHAKLFIHETWGYEDGSEKLINLGYKSEKQMYSDVSAAYKKAAALIRADGIIPCGRAMLYGSEFGLKKLRRDTFHASLGAGRYLLALTWYKAFTGKDISSNDFCDFDEPVGKEERKTVIKAVNAAFGELNSKPLSGKTVLFLGDSLTEGVHGPSSQDKRYANVFATLTGAEVYVYGVGGTRIAFQFKPTTYRPRHDMYFASRVQDMREGADYVVVFGGINDYFSGDAPLGSFGDSTPETFYGALYDLFAKLKEKYPLATIIAVTPMNYGEGIEHSAAATGKQKGGLKAFADAIKQVAKACGVKVIDAFGEWEIDPANEELRKKYFTGDEIHPNDDGHRYIAERLAESFGKLK